MGRFRVRKPLRMETQPRLLSPEFRSGLTVLFWSELGQEPRTTRTGSAGGKNSLMSQPVASVFPSERGPSPASRPSVDNWGPWRAEDPKNLPPSSP